METNRVIRETRTYVEGRGLDLTSILEWSLRSLVVFYSLREKVNTVQRRPKLDPKDELNLQSRYVKKADGTLVVQSYFMAMVEQRASQLDLYLVCPSKEHLNYGVVHLLSCSGDLMDVLLVIVVVATSINTSALCFL